MLSTQITNLLTMASEKTQSLVNFTNLDYGIIAIFFVIVVGIGLWASRSAGQSSSEFFLGGRGMPWWLLGVSMVACTFSADTPNLVAGLVREGGAAKNWCWWAFLITGMITVFIYAKLWRRSSLDTDLGFYELRYGGKPASFLRGFRSIYLGLFFNVLIMATVTLAIIKYGSLMFGIPKWQCVVFGSIGVAIYATLGGIKGCIWADFFQYSIAMFGAVYAACVAVKSSGTGSLQELIASPEVASKINVFPNFSDINNLIPLLIIPVAIQWWAVWYPGAEPGGGGYIAQRMLSAKDEKNAIGATLFFNFAHYALRPWPWIVVALASLICFPMDSKQDAKIAEAKLKEPAMVKIEKNYKDLTNTAEYKKAKKSTANAQDLVATFPAAKEYYEKYVPLDMQKRQVTSIQKAFPHVDQSIIAQDLGYPVMIAKLGPGMLGLVIASIIAAYMSTIGTHLNWGSSYIVNDFYKRFIKPSASEKEMVNLGRFCTLALMVIAGISACFLESATQAFDILLLSGAGSGAIYLLRWFWWRINAWTEIVAMAVATIVAVVLVVFIPVDSLRLTFDSIQVADPETGGLTALVLDGSTVRLLLAVIITTIAWIVTTFVTPAEDTAVLRSFFRKCHPGGPGWEKIVSEARAEGDMIDEKIHGKAWEMPVQLLCVFLGCIAIYCALFGIGAFVCAAITKGIILCSISLVCTLGLFKCFGKLNAE